MFTGLIRHRGELAYRGGSRLDILCRTLSHNLQPGASVAVNGVCLTAARLLDGGFSADLLPETLACTTLGDLPLGQFVNLEQPLCAGEEFGGHFVTGHADGIARLLDRTRSNPGAGGGHGGPPYQEEAETWTYAFELPDWLSPWVIPKGSIALDGVSLTIQTLNERSFSVALIPETLNRTTLGDIQPGQAVNVEADMLIKAAIRAAKAALGQGQN